MGRNRAGLSRRALVGVVGVLVALVVVPVTAHAEDGWVGSVVRFEPLRRATTGFSADGGAGHRGSMEIRAGGRVLVDLLLEDYVHGIQEVPASWPAAAQRAQAIASRTYALNQVMAARRANGWMPDAADLCATEQCQVYTGLASEHRPTASAWQAAASATAGHVLVFDGAPILAKYSASNGGRSVAGGAPFLPSVDDPDDAVSPNHTWSQVLDPVALAHVLGAPDGTVVAARRDGDVAVLAVDRSGAQTEVRLDAHDLYDRVNAALAKNGLPRVFPSDRYALSFRDGHVVADGNGYGHGIGMGQWGAMGKASRGLDHPAILSSYYGPAVLAYAPAGSPANVRVGLPNVTAPVVRAVPVAGAPAGLFRVRVDGKVVAVTGGGAWSVRTVGGAVRVVPPSGWVAAPDSPDDPPPGPAPLPGAHAKQAAAAAPSGAPGIAAPPAGEPPAPVVTEVKPTVPEAPSIPAELAAAAAAAPPAGGGLLPRALVFGVAAAVGASGEATRRLLRRTKRDPSLR